MRQIIVEREDRRGNVVQRRLRADPRIGALAFEQPDDALAEPARAAASRVLTSGWRTAESGTPS